MLLYPLTGEIKFIIGAIQGIKITSFVVNVCVSETIDVGTGQLWSS
ncbi:MAG TPA: hypothetical protein PL104_06615 [Caldisericia bacterium]|nr:hypothetical protein [Caldisericia bacterium]HQO99517.1 hypothetical protein [Caldisericia bacterium]